jgi:hypothetical protein
MIPSLAGAAVGTTIARDRVPNLDRRNLGIRRRPLRRSTDIR